MAEGRYMILSSDAHAGAPMADYKAFLASRWHDDFDVWLAAVINPWADVNDTRNWHSGDRLAAMDAEGISGEVLFPNTLPPFFDMAAHLGGLPRTQGDYERRWAGLRAHNRWIVGFCQEVPLRRRALVQLLPNDIDDALAEMRWASGETVVGGVMLPAVPANHEVDPYYHERYDPLWAAAVELGLPVHHHQGSGTPDPRGDGLLGRSINYVDQELWTRQTLSHLIVGGIFERHPDLKMVWTEMPGLRWVLEDLERITRQLPVIQSRYSDDPTQLNYHYVFGSPTVDGLTRTPLEYFRRNCFLGASLLSPSDMEYVDVIGADRIMWGHDAPHQEGSGGLATAALQAVFHDRTVADCQMMLSETAADLYHFDRQALSPVAAEIGPKVSVVHTPLLERPVSRGSAFWASTSLADAR